jgi:hypothetical protein
LIMLFNKGRRKRNNESVSRAAALQTEGRKGVGYVSR